MIFKFPPSIHWNRINLRFIVLWKVIYGAWDFTDQLKGKWNDVYIIIRLEVHNVIHIVLVAVTAGRFITLYPLAYTVNAIATWWWWWWCEKILILIIAVYINWQGCGLWTYVYRYHQSWPIYCSYDLFISVLMTIVITVTLINHYLPCYYLPNTHTQFKHI